MPSIKELYELWDQAFSKQEELEREMDRIIAKAKNREAGERQAIKGIVHDINAARGLANAAWKKYQAAIQEARNAEVEQLSKLEKKLAD